LSLHNPLTEPRASPTTINGVILIGAGGGIEGKGHDGLEYQHGPRHFDVRPSIYYDGVDLLIGAVADQHTVSPFWS
jgi:hypothetical protein